MEEIALLRDKIGQLIKQHKALEKAHAVLQKKCAQKDREIATLQQDVQSSGTQLLAAETNKILESPEERTRVRKQLDSVINEIDQILITLND